MKDNIKRELVSSLLNWAGHGQRMEGGWMTTRADALIAQGRKIRG